MSVPLPDEEQGLRPLMFSIAYRMTGSVSESEDLAQEAFFRLARARHSGVLVESPKAFLITALTRLAIDHLRLARVQRESYIGTWLPEPLVSELSQSPEQMAELSDSLSMAFLVLLESLSPVERAVFLLREIFDYPYEDIAEVVDKNEANCRQIFARARQHLGAHRARYKAATEDSEALLRAFLSAAQEGNLDGLVELLAADAAFFGDGGGKASAVRQPIFGRERVARFVLSLFEQAGRLSVSVEAVLVNGGPGLITRDPAGRVISVLSIEMLDGVVQSVRSVVNPDKLRHLGPVSDLGRSRRTQRDDRA